MLTVEEVARRLGVHRITVYRWCYTGQLKSLKFGGVRRIEESTLEEFIRARDGDKAGTTPDTHK